MKTKRFGEYGTGEVTVTKHVDLRDMTWKSSDINWSCVGHVGLDQARVFLDAMWGAVMQAEAWDHEFPEGSNANG